MKTFLMIPIKVGGRQKESHRMAAARAWDRFAK
jgi:hypothetical protein